MSIKDWYIKNYASDELGREINPLVGFKDCLRMMENGKDFYDIIDVVDSVIRERVFKEIARVHNISYDEVYNLWINN